MVLVMVLRLALFGASLGSIDGVSTRGDHEKIWQHVGPRNIFDDANGNGDGIDCLIAIILCFVCGCWQKQTTVHFAPGCQQEAKNLEPRSHPTC